ncbi:unnamed protein product [Owenia fusiformis]|uniref:Uncharacterized protein n=1 Tax=Owenia fusiformis TaxID=6347 RepID=A0A8J1Y637_OWEFU|nr:unnamed protein product [Owenia fusiformis]
MSGRRSSRNRDTTDATVKKNNVQCDDNVDGDDITVETVSKILLFNEADNQYENAGDKTRRGKTTLSREDRRRKKMEEKEKLLKDRSHAVNKPESSLENQTEPNNEVPTNKRKSLKAGKSKGKSGQQDSVDPSGKDNEIATPIETVPKRPGRPPKSSKRTQLIPKETKKDSEKQKDNKDSDLSNDLNLSRRPTRGRSAQKTQSNGVDDKAIRDESIKSPIHDESIKSPIHDESIKSPSEYEETPPRKSRRKSASPRKAVNSHEPVELENDSFETGTINFPISNGLPSKRKAGRLRNSTDGVSNSIEPSELPNHVAPDIDIPIDQGVKRKRGRPKKSLPNIGSDSVPLKGSNLGSPSNVNFLEYQGNSVNDSGKKRAGRPKQGKGRPSKESTNSKQANTLVETLDGSQIDQHVYNKWKSELVAIKKCKCPICKVCTRSTIDAMIVHYKTCTPIDTDCKLCTPVKPFTTLPGLKYHLAVVHAKLHTNPKNLNEEEIEEKIFSMLHSKINCPNCQSAFISLSRYRYHKTICGREYDNMNCPECKVSLMVIELKDHLFKEHKIGTPDSDASDVEAESTGPKEFMASGATKRGAAKRAIKTMKTLGQDDDMGEGPKKEAKNKKKKSKIKLEFEENVSDSGSEYDVGKDKEESTDDESPSEVDESDDNNPPNSDDETPSARKTIRIRSSKAQSSVERKYKYKAKYWVRQMPLQSSNLGRSLEKQFQKLYYTEVVPITQWHSCIDDWSTISPDEQQSYLPMQTNVSFGVKETSGPIEDVCLSRFGVNRNKNCVSIFAGGPVWSLAWCPTPVTEPNATQYLAVGSHRDANETYSCKYQSSSNGMIQIWNCGALHSKTPDSVTPKLVMTIAHEWGGVWAMKWCPCGAWEKADSMDTPNLPRLGLLALACSDGMVRIISIPHPEFLNDSSSSQDQVNTDNSESTNPPMYKAKSIVELRPTASSTKFGNCLCLDWAVQDNAAIICGSFGNGFVCLWNIYSTSPLITSGLDTKNPTLLPYKVFQAECFPLKAIAFCPQNPRYLVTGGPDQQVRFWDTMQTSFPVKEILVGPITSIYWPHYLGTVFVVCEDGFGPASGLFSIIWEHGDFECNRLFTTSCSMNQVVHNHWLDTVTVATVPGSIFGYIPTGEETPIRFRYKYDHNRKYLLCKTLYEILPSANKDTPGPSSGSTTPRRNPPESNTDTDSVTDSIESEPNRKEKESTSHKISMNLTLEDSKLRDMQSSVKSINEFINKSSLSSELPTCTSINRITWNPNYKSCHWLPICLTKVGSELQIDTCCWRKLTRHIARLDKDCKLTDNVEVSSVDGWGVIMSIKLHFTLSIKTV